MTALALPRPQGGLSDRLRAAARAGLISLAVAFTNAGCAIVTNRMMQAGTAPLRIGWGTGATPAAVTQTSLVSEAAPTTGGGRVVGTEARTTGTVPNDTYQVAGTVTAVSSLAITEAALFDAASSGNMLIRGDFAPVNVVAGDSIAFAISLRIVANAI
jgi:hypothetical protein